MRCLEKQPATVVYTKFQPFLSKIYDIFGVVKARPGKYKVQKVEEFLNTDESKIIYDVTYTINEFGDRSTPFDDSESIDKHIITFGCSFTFGEGLNDNETIAYQFAKQTNNFEPYNFGFHGDGPFDILAKVENYEFDRVLNQKGIVLYILVNGHIFRVKGDMKEMSWGEDRPYYQLINGQVTRKGSFLTGRPLLSKTLRFLNNSKILMKLKKHRLLPVTTHDFELTARTIEKTFEIFRKKLPGYDHFLVIYPKNPQETDCTTKILKRLENSNINILDYRDLFDPCESEYNIVDDGHPTAYANEVLVKKIIEDLGLQ